MHIFSLIWKNIVDTESVHDKIKKKPVKNLYTVFLSIIVRIIIKLYDESEA